ncbi:unnamed protein product [Hymenolepis diminuta]|nr:unnamed protein product [Hymenolepis diminuta]
MALQDPACPVKFLRGRYFKTLKVEPESKQDPQPAGKEEESESQNTLTTSNPNVNISRQSGNNESTEIPPEFH